MTLLSAALSASTASESKMMQRFRQKMGISNGNGNNPPPDFNVEKPLKMKKQQRPTFAPGSPQVITYDSSSSISSASSTSSSSSCSCEKLKMLEQEEQQQSIFLQGVDKETQRRILERRRRGNSSSPTSSGGGGGGGGASHDDCKRKESQLKAKIMSDQKQIEELSMALKNIQQKFLQQQAMLQKIAAAQSQAQSQRPGGPGPGAMMMPRGGANDHGDDGDSDD